jgi:hypothetical protein
MPVTVVLTLLVIHTSLYSYLIFYHNIVYIPGYAVPASSVREMHTAVKWTERVSAALPDKHYYGKS